MITFFWKLKFEHLPNFETWTLDLSIAIFINSLVFSWISHFDNPKLWQVLAKIKSISKSDQIKSIYFLFDNPYITFILKTLIYSIFTSWHGSLNLLLGRKGFSKFSRVAYIVNEWMSRKMMSLCILSWKKDEQQLI